MKAPPVASVALVVPGGQRLVSRRAAVERERDQDRADGAGRIGPAQAGGGRLVQAQGEALRRPDRASEPPLRAQRVRDAERSGRAKRDQHVAVQRRRRGWCDVRVHRRPGRQHRAGHGITHHQEAELLIPARPGEVEADPWGDAEVLAADGRGGGRADVIEAALEVYEVELTRLVFRERAWA